MPNYRNVHPYAVVVDNPPTTCEPGSVYEFAQVLDADGNVVSPNPNFFEETTDPVTVDPSVGEDATSQTIGDALVEGLTAGIKAGRTQPAPALSKAAASATPDSTTTEPEETV